MWLNEGKTIINHAQNHRKWYQPSKHGVVYDCFTHIILLVIIYKWLSPPKKLLSNSSFSSTAPSDLRLVTVEVHGMLRTQGVHDLRAVETTPNMAPRFRNKQPKISGHFRNQEQLEVPTIYNAYGSGLCKAISPQNMALYGTVPPF